MSVLDGYEVAGLGFVPDLNIDFVHNCSEGGSDKGVEYVRAVSSEDGSHTELLSQSVLHGFSPYREFSPRPPSQALFPQVFPLRRQCSQGQQ